MGGTMIGRRTSLAMAMLFGLTSVSRGAENWPMFNHDPALSGHTGEYVDGPVQLRWQRQFPTGAHVRAQPVIVDNVIYLGFFDGTFHAIDINTGQDIWTVGTGSPILGSACVVNGTVVVASFDGTVRGFSTGGSQQWNITLGDNITASPITYNGLVYLGAADETFYAISPANGAIAWSRKVGGRILGPAAAADGVVVVMADDMKAYAFSTAGSQLWTANLPGESLKQTYPIMAQGTVLFTTVPRCKQAGGTEGEPYWSDHELDVRWDGSPPQFATPDDLLAANLGFFNSYPPGNSTLAVNLQTGAKKFDVPLATPYWGQMAPVMINATLAVKQAHVRLWTINMATGQIRVLGNGTSGDPGLLFRGDEYTYALSGGNKFYGAVADDLGVVDFNALTNQTLVGDFFSHAVNEWVHPPDATNAYLTAPGPGDGNTGYVSSPIPYNGNIVWLNCGSWLMCHRGTGGNISTSPPPASPKNLRLR